MTNVPGRVVNSNGWTLTCHKQNTSSNVDNNQPIVSKTAVKLLVIFPISLHSINPSSKIPVKGDRLIGIEKRGSSKNFDVIPDINGQTE